MSTVNESGYTLVPAKDLVEMRKNKVLLDEEIAYIAGDLILAENILTKVRRVIGSSEILAESSKRLLKG